MQYLDGDTLLQPLSTMGGTPTGLQYFINYINVLEGAKTKIIDTSKCFSNYF